MANVHVDAAGQYTVTSGDSTTTHASLREALDTALPGVATHEKAATLRNPDTGDLNGAWRWLPATDVEPTAVGGVRIDAQAIDEMAASLNARPGPIPIDGGPTPAGMLPSEVHGTAFTGGGTLANGWAHWGVVVAGPGETDAKLYLFAEMVPEVARELDSGRMATGSVHFGYASVEGEVPRGVELISHALTNDPAVKTLAPANSVRTGALLTVRRGTQANGAVLRARETTMTKKNATRGQAMEAEAKIFGMLGIDPNDPDADWKARSVICSIMEQADAEEAIAGVLGGGAPPAPAATQAAASAQFRGALKALDALVEAKNAKGLAAALRDAVVSPVVAAADPAAGAASPSAPVAGLADEPAKDTFITSVLAALVNAGIAPDANDAAAALAALQAWKPSEPCADPTQQMSSEAGKSAAHGAVIEQLRGELSQLRTEVNELRPLREEKRARDHAEYVDIEAKKRGVTLLPAVRAKFLALSKEAVDASLDALRTPPTGSVMPNGVDESGDGAFETATQAIDSLIPEALKKAPKNGEPAQHTRSRATRIAKERFPHLFGLVAASDAG